MEIFEKIRLAVTAREAAERYGISVNRRGMACCPFHPDKHPSMKLDQRFHCFGCQADGDAINLVCRLFDLRPLEGAQKLAEDFGIDYEKHSFHKKKKELKPQRKRTANEHMAELERKLEKWLSHAYEVFLRYMRWIEFWKDFYKPQITDEDWHPLFCEALENISRIDWYLDTLLFGDEKERLDFFMPAGRR